MPDISNATQATRGRSASCSSTPSRTASDTGAAAGKNRSEQAGPRRGLFDQDSIENLGRPRVKQSAQPSVQGQPQAAASGAQDAPAPAKLSWSARLQERCRSLMQRATAGLQSFVSTAAHSLFNCMTLLQELGDFLVDFGKTLLKVTRSMPDLRAPTMTDEELRRRR